MPCCLVGSYQHFIRTCCIHPEDGGTEFLQTIYQTTWYHNPEGHSFENCISKNRNNNYDSKTKKKEACVRDMSSRKCLNSQPGLKAPQRNPQTTEQSFYCHPHYIPSQHILSALSTMYVLMILKTKCNRCIINHNQERLPSVGSHSSLILWQVHACTKGCAHRNTYMHIQINSVFISATMQRREKFQHIL